MEDLIMFTVLHRLRNFESSAKLTPAVQAVLIAKYIYTSIDSVPLRIYIVPQSYISVLFQFALFDIILVTWKGIK